MTKPALFIDGQPHPALADLVTAERELREWADACADARTWGGPTMYPPNPITEQRARGLATTLKWTMSALRALSQKE